MAAELRTIVVDNGSQMIKVGFAGDDNPRSIFPTIVGRPKRPQASLKDSYVGDMAQSKRALLNLKRPIERGRISSFDDMETIWQHAFSEDLKVDITTHRALLSEPALSTKGDREKIAQIMYETFNVPHFYLANEGCLTVGAAGRMNGIAVNLGDTLTSVVPVWDSKPVKAQAKYLEVGGGDITDYLMTLLGEKGYALTSPAERMMAYDMKESHCRVALDFDAELEKVDPAHEVTYELFPGADEYKFNQERFRAPEVLFRPQLLGRKGDGVADMLSDAINESGASTHKELFNNIILGGGPSVLPGFAARLEKDLRHLNISANIRLIARSNLKYSVWVGGSTLGSMDLFPLAWVSKQAYTETGASLIHANLD